MEQTQKGWVGEVSGWPCKVVKALVAQGRKRSNHLKNRYGPRYTHALVAAAFVTLFLPIPGISLLAVALIVAVAEVDRAISRENGLGRAGAKEIVMSLSRCAILLWTTVLPRSVRTSHPPEAPARRFPRGRFL